MKPDAPHGEPPKPDKPWQALRRAPGLPEALGMLISDQEPVVIERDGVAVGVMVSLDVFERLVEGVRKLVAKDLSDIEAAKKQDADVAETGRKPVPWQQVKKVLEDAKKALGNLEKAPPGSK